MSRRPNKNQLGMLGIVIVLLLVAIAYAKYGTTPSQRSSNSDVQPQNSNSKRTDADASDPPFHQIQQLKGSHLPAGTYLTEGYVIKKTVCPPDPQPGLSAPCPKDHMIISETNRSTETFPLGEKDVVVYLKTSTAFKIGKRYRLKVKKTTYLNSQGKEESSFELLDEKVVEQD